MRSFLGVRLQTRTLLSSNPPDRRLESSDILTVFKLQERQEDYETKFITKYTRYFDPAIMVKGHLRNSVIFIDLPYP